MSAAMASTGGFYGFSTDPPTLAYHPVGNIPPVDLTEGRRLPPSPELLLLGCGDIRSLLYTAHVLHTSCPPSHLPGALHFHLNDIEAGILARDLVLLRLASSGEATHFDSEDARFLWSVWYECLLRTDHATRLKETLKNLYDDVSRRGDDDDVRESPQDDVTRSGDDVTCHQADAIRRSDDVRQDLQDDIKASDVTGNDASAGTIIDFRFGNEATRESIKGALEEFGRLSVSTTDVFKGRNGYMGKWRKAFNRVGLLTEKIASVFQEQQGCMKDPQLRVRCRKEIEGFVQTGMTSVPWSTQNEAELRRNYTGNPTYFRPGNPTWCITEGACVFLSRDLDLSAAGYDGRETTLSSLFFRQMVEHVRSFQALQRQGVKITFTLWHGEALELSDSVLPASLKFDVINTSNLVDNVGLLNLLVMYGSRLRPGSGIIAIQSFFWHTEGNLQMFLKKFLPIDPFMIQTLLGIKWEGDERLYNSTSLRLGTFVGREAYRFYLRSTPEPSEKIKLTGDDGLMEALRTVLSACLKLTCPMLAFRPMVSGIRTYLHLIKNLSRRVEGGIDAMRGATFAMMLLSEDPVVLASVPSFAALTTLYQGHIGRPTDEDLVEVSVPVEVVGEEELHFCYIILTPFSGLDEALGMLRMQLLFPDIPPPRPVIIKDFTFDHRQKRVAFVLRKTTWESTPSSANACFENCAEGRDCLLKMVHSVKSVATVKHLSRIDARATEDSSAVSGQELEATRRGIASLQLVENHDSYVVSIRTEKDFKLPLSIVSGETSHHIKVTTGSGRSGLQWKAILPCEVDADLATADVDMDDDDDDDGDNTLEIYIPKDEANLSSVLSDWRPMDARKLPSYTFNKHSELTLYLNFWRMFPSEGVHLGKDLLSNDLALHVTMRDLMLETVHAAIHRGTPLVVSVERKEEDIVRHFLMFHLHGFKVIGDAPALVVTVMWPEAAIALITAGKLRKRAFDREMGDLLRLPHHAIAFTFLHQIAIPPLVDRLKVLKKQLLQDPQRDEPWIFQSYIKPFHSELNWVACYSGTNTLVGFPGAMSNLLRSAISPSKNVQDYSWCCPRGDFAAMCLKCLLASGKEFHHMQKNSEDSAMGMLSMGSIITTFYCEVGTDPKICSYCGSLQERLNECKSCRKVRYCCEECQDRDMDNHKKDCASPSFSPFSALTTQSSEDKDPRDDERSSPASGDTKTDPSKKTRVDPHDLGGARSKNNDDSSVSWWKPAAKVQSSKIKGKKSSGLTLSPDATASKTKDQRSIAKGREPVGKLASCESSSLRSEKPSVVAKTGESNTSKTKGQDERSSTKGHRKPPGKSAVAENSTVSWWKPGAKVQSSVSQGSTRLPGQETPACSDKSGAISDAILEERGIRDCDVCGKASGHLKRCGRCRTGSYCSSECQSKAWKEHRKSCNATT